MASFNLIKDKAVRGAESDLNHIKLADVEIFGYSYALYDEK